MDKLNGEIPKIDKRICILEQLEVLFELASLANRWWTGGQPGLPGVEPAATSSTMLNQRDLEISLNEGSALNSGHGDEEEDRDGDEPKEGAVEVGTRRPRGRPPGSKNKPKPPVFMTRDSPNALRSHVMEVAGGSDVAESIAQFARRRQKGCACSVEVVRLPTTVPAWFHRPDGVPGRWAGTGGGRKRGRTTCGGRASAIAGAATGNSSPVIESNGGQPEHRLPDLSPFPIYNMPPNLLPNGAQISHDPYAWTHARPPY
ncbi:hypothetical protein C3L33_15049, partial [Rhododendron williamsianum]